MISPLESSAEFEDAIDARTEPIRIIAVRYPLKSAVHTANYSYFERTGAIVRLCDDDEVTGYGEALPLPTWPDGDVTKVMRSLSRWHDQMRSATTETIVGLNSTLPDHPVAAFAVDTARISIAGQRANRLGAELIAPAAKITTRIRVNAMISAPSPEGAAEQAAAAMSKGYEAVKLKVARDHISVDVDRVAAVRDTVGEDVAIRLDANQGWSASTMPDNLDRLSGFGVEYIEEPTASLSAMNKLRDAGAPMPIYLDEHLSSSRNVHQVIISGYADGLVLKPALLGRLGLTRELAQHALSTGMKVTLTNALDSGIGTSAAIHVAASLGDLVNACGFGTGEIFSEVVAPLPTVRNGEVRVLGPGFGVNPTLLPEVMAPDLADSGARQRSKFDRVRGKKRR